MSRKLISIDKLYPPEEIARRVERFERFFAGQEIDEPLICPVHWRTNYVNTLNADEAADKFAATMEVQARLGGNNIPAYNCVMGTCALASAFGGQPHQTENKVWWTDPVVHKAEDVYRLKPPKPLDGLVGKAVEVFHKVSERIDGYVPPRVPDMQGPLNTASMIWEQNSFLLALYDEPKAVHHLLGLVTDHIISVYRHFRDNFEQANLMSWPFIYMPRRYGVGMTEDFIHLISPELWEEFGLPYVNRIADEFGGVYIHCCGVFHRHWPSVKKVRNLRGLDTMHPYSKPAEVFRAFPDIVHTVWLDYAEGVRNFRGRGPLAFTEFLLDSMPAGLRYIFGPDAPEEPTVHRQMELIRSKFQVPSTESQTNSNDLNRQ